MVIIFSQGDSFWIESFEFARDFVDAGIIETKTFTLSKAGTYLGGSATIDSQNADAATQQNLSATMKTTGNTHLTLGDNITAFNIQLGNNNGGGVTFGAYVFVFMRRPAK